MKLINKETRVLVQGITGAGGSFHTREMLEYGTKIVAGVTPGKGGLKVEGVPVFNSVEEALKREGPIDVSAIFVPPFIKILQSNGDTLYIEAAKDAVMEAIEAQISLVVCITEKMPQWQTVEIKAYLDLFSNVRLLGPNCPGIIVPTECKIGLYQNYAFKKKGNVAVISRSGSLSFDTSNELRKAGFKFSVVAGIGGDPIVGTSFKEMLELVESDPDTEMVLIAGEIGGDLEERAADYICNTCYLKPVLFFIAGVFAPAGQRLGHAGAIISREGEGLDKATYIKNKGLKVCLNVLEIGQAMKELLC